MIFRNRPLVRLGAALLLTAGGLAAVGAPAYASPTETDLSLALSGTRVAEGAIGKIAMAKITNRGENTPASLTVTLDVSKVDFRRAFVESLVEECDLKEGPKGPLRWTCEVPEEVLPGPGETLDLPIAVFKSGEVKGTYSAPITVTISSPGDPNKENDRRTAKIELTGENGPDLTVFAEDVKDAVKIRGGEWTLDGELYPGKTGLLVAGVINQGDAPAAGVKVTVKLPKGVSFARPEELCEYDAAGTSAVCTYRDLPLVPLLGDDEGEGDEEAAVLVVEHLLTVDKKVKPGALTGGQVNAEPLAGTVAPVRAKSRPLPANVTIQKHVKDVDASDNTDRYAVIVAARGGGGGGGEEPGLPVTGPQAGLIGGIGAAVLLAGGALFLISRRRRVVLVAPADENSHN